MRRRAQQQAQQARNHATNLQRTAKQHDQRGEHKMAKISREGAAVYNADAEKAEARGKRSR